MNLFERFQLALKNAKEAFDLGTPEGLESGRTFRAEAETLKSLIDEQRGLDDIAKSMPAQRPILPNTSDVTLPQVAGQSQEQVTSSSSEGTVKATLGAAYQTKFGDTSSAVKQILTEMHGSGFEGDYWSQKSAFRRYLRLGNEALSTEQRTLLHTLVMTPSAVKMALSEGIEDMNSFKSTMVEAADTLGGFMVPVDFQMNIIQRLAGLSTLRAEATKMNTNRDRVELPEATGSSGKYTSPVRVTWVDETPTLGAIAEANVTFGMRGISVHTAMSETPLSRNLVEDSAFDIEGFIAKKLAESAAIDENKQFVTGSGVGKPLGLLPGAANFHAFTEPHSLSGSALTWDGLIGVPFSVPAQYRNQGSKWLMNKATMQAIALLKDAGNQYLWEPYHFTGGDGNPINTTLLGYPILEDEDMPDIAANAYPILFGDFSAYTIVDRLGMTVERYIDSSTARQNLVYYVMRRRLGGAPIETWRLSALKVAS